MCSKMEEITFDEKKLAEELIRGRDSTKKLQNLLRRKDEGDGSVSVDDLVMRILGSFADGLLVLGSGEIPASGDVGSGCSGENGKRPAPAVKDRRGCYKRRKTADSRISVAKTIEDGHAWRKYGQKEILNAKFPRCYFRCTHRTIQGCKALKQVQKLEDGSEMFHIMYFGHHTCQNMQKNTQIFSDPGVLNSFLLNFEDSKNYLSTVTHTHVVSVKQEDEQSEVLSDNVSSINYEQSSLTLWKDVIGNLVASHETPSTIWFDHEDSCASTSSRDYFDLKMFGSDGSISDIQFDEVDFL